MSVNLTKGFRTNASLLCPFSQHINAYYHFTTFFARTSPLCTYIEMYSYGINYALATKQHWTLLQWTLFCTIAQVKLVLRLKLSGKGRDDPFFSVVLGPPLKISNTRTVLRNIFIWIRGYECRDRFCSDIWFNKVPIYRNAIIFLNSFYNNEGLFMYDDSQILRFCYRIRYLLKESVIGWDGGELIKLIWSEDNNDDCPKWNWIGKQKCLNLCGCWNSLWYET